MDVAEVLELVEELVFTKTGENLDYLQEAILRGTLQGDKYSEIAAETHSSEGHVRDVGSELWKILSEGLGKNISKSNCKAILEKANFYDYSSAIVSDNVTVNNVNVCSQTAQSSTTTQPSQQTQPRVDLGDVPEVFSFYGRTEELSTLEDLILQKRCRLITLLGINGIGKTSLVLQLIEQIKTNFDYVIYRSLRFSPTLDETLADLIQIFPNEAGTSRNNKTQSQLLNHLRQYRCLIIFDDVQLLFSNGQFAGNYKSGYENYQMFFKLIAESHQSCLILSSWEKPREVAILERKNNLVCSFILEGLGDAAKEILREQQLLDEETWGNLINTYQGNPLWLESAAMMIQELFGGRVAEFLQCNDLVLSELQAHLNQQFDRLTSQEQVVIIQLAKENESVSLSQVLKTVQLSPSDLLNAMQSLGRRLLLNTKEQDKTTFFTLNLVWKQYLKNRKLS